MRKFVVTVDGGTRDEQNAITQWLYAQEWGVWHYFEDAWLISSASSTMTAKELSEKLETLIGKKSHVVIQIEGQPVITYWGRAAKVGWEWMKKHWGKPSS